LICYSKIHSDHRFKLQEQFSGALEVHKPLERGSWSTCIQAAVRKLRYYLYTKQKCKW